MLGYDQRRGDIKILVYDKNKKRAPYGALQEIALLKTII